MMSINKLNYAGARGTVRDHWMKMKGMKQWYTGILALFTLFSCFSVKTLAQNGVGDPQTNQENTSPNFEYDPDQANNPLHITYRAPDNTTAIQACAGERLIYRVEAQDKYDRKRQIGTTAWSQIPGVGPYQIKLYTSAGGTFDSATGPTSEVISGLASGNVNLYISSTWNGTAITVTAIIQDLAPNPVPAPDTGTTKDSDVTLHWTINPRSGGVPTRMYQVAPAVFNQWTPATAHYIYRMDPVPPHYQGQTVLESFGATLAVFTMADLEPGWKTAHPTLTTPNMVCQFLFDSGGNSSFVIDGSDQIYDQHGGFGDTIAFTAAAWASGIGYILPQTYSACNHNLGSYSIERRWQNGNITVRKTGP